MSTNGVEEIQENKMTISEYIEYLISNGCSKEVAENTAKVLSSEFIKEE